MEPGKAPRRFWPWLLVGIGYLLSPLSWWNDLFINIPLAYVIASLVGLISHRLFAPALVAGYWLTNLAGVVLLQQGTAHLVGREGRPKLLPQLLAATAYTALIVLLLVLGVLRPLWPVRP